MKPGKQKMTQAKALQLIKKHRPATLLAAHNLGLRMRHIGGGAFRQAYHIKNTELVIKFPDSSDWFESRRHTRDEAKAIKKLSKFKALREHLPKLYYFDDQTGVIVTHYYPRKTSRDEYLGYIPAVLWVLMHELTGIHFSDGYIQNTRIATGEKDGRGWTNHTLKFIDLGC